MSRKCRFVIFVISNFLVADDDGEDDFPPKDEDEVSIPRASLNKFIKDVVPDARLTTETRELLLNCCHVFIHTLATKANVACAAAKKKTISPEHVFQGLDAMNLSAYKERAVVASKEAKEELMGRRMLSASYRYKHQNGEEFERLMHEQQRIFQQARAEFEGEQIDRSDLLVASELADATVVSQGATSTVLDTNNQHASNSASLCGAPLVDNTAVPNVTGSGRLFGAVSLGDDDNYDE